MRSLFSLSRAGLLASLILLSASAPARAAAGRAGYPRVEPSHADYPHVDQETGFLNRQIVVQGAVHRFQVYLPEQWRRGDHKLWPVVLFLHGRGERGEEGMWQTQVGLPQAVRDHPERWPFVIVMPQCPFGSFWTDPESLTMAMAALDQETAEFRGDPERTYLTGLSMGGYGAWELVRLHPHRFAAIALASGGIFWSYAPERWQKSATLPGEYAHALGRTAAWLFHGTDDPMVAPRQDELLYEAIKAQRGRVRLWLYQGLRHDCWTRAFNEADLPRWLLSHHLEPTTPAKGAKEPPPYAERTLIPLHLPAIHLTPAQFDALVGEYVEPHGKGVLTLTHQGDQLIERNQYGELFPLEAESPSVLFYLGGSSLSRILVERDREGRITALIVHDDRHEERWERRATSPAASRPSPPTWAFSTFSHPPANLPTGYDTVWVPHPSRSLRRVGSQTLSNRSLLY
jgi:predicted esterase